VSTGRMISAGLSLYGISMKMQVPTMSKGWPQTPNLPLNSVNPSMNSLYILSRKKVRRLPRWVHPRAMWDQKCPHRSMVSVKVEAPTDCL
jgi:hypothetical protein